MAAFVAIHPLSLALTHSPWVILGVPLLVWLLAATRRLNDLRREWWLAWLPWIGFGGAAMLAGLMRSVGQGAMAPTLRVASVLAGVLALITVAYLGIAPRPPEPTSVDLSTFD